MLSGTHAESHVAIVEQSDKHVVALADSVPITISSSALSAWDRNIGGYKQTVSVAGGTAPMTFSVSVGTLPSGLALNAATGVISGTPTGNLGTSTFTVKVLDASHAVASKQFQIQINPQVTITTSSLPSWDVNQPGYNRLIATSGGTAPLMFSLASGAKLPDGLNLDSKTGSITGTPTTLGLWSFPVVVTDGAGASSFRAYAFWIVVPISLSDKSYNFANSGYETLAFNWYFAWGGGIGPRTFSLISGVLPDGITMNASTGTLTGTPGKFGTFNFTIQVIDGAGAADTQAYTITIRKLFGSNSAFQPTDLAEIDTTVP